jgi:4-hydroxybenzoate polyprenyltransferase
LKKPALQLTAAFFYYNFFIAACAASLVIETAHLFKLLPGIYWFALLVFCCTANIYTFHYYQKIPKQKQDERTELYRKNKNLVIFLLVAGCITISFLLITHRNVLFTAKTIFWILLIPIISIGYSFPFLPGKKSLRHIGWLKLPLLSFVWSFTTVMLPALFSENKEINPAQLWILFFHRFFFIATLAVLFNIRDYDEDKRDGVITPAVKLGPAKILFAGKWLMSMLNLAMSILLCRFFNLHSPLQYAAVLIPVIVLFCFFHFFRPAKNELQFSFLHDGLIPVKVLLLIFATSL